MKTHFQVATLSTLVLALAACGGKPESASAPPPPPAQTAAPAAPAAATPAALPRTPSPALSTGR